MSFSHFFSSSSTNIYKEDSALFRQLAIQTAKVYYTRMPLSKDRKYNDEGQVVGLNAPIEIIKTKYLSIYILTQGRSIFSHRVQPYDITGYYVV